MSDLTQVTSVPGRRREDQRRAQCVEVSLTSNLTPVRAKSHPGLNFCSDALIVNLGTPEYAKEETPHPRDLDNWHCDGDFFRHVSRSQLFAL